MSRVRAPSPAPLSHCDSVTYGVAPRASGHSAAASGQIVAVTLWPLARGVCPLGLEKRPWRGRERGWSEVERQPPALTVHLVGGWPSLPEGEQRSTSSRHSATHLAARFGRVAGSGVNSQPGGALGGNLS